MESLEDLAARIRMMIRSMKRRAQALGGADGPTQTETLVLGYLDEQGAMTPGDLSAAQHVRPQTMGETLDAMKERGWIERRPHPEDRRRILISLTTAGRRALTKGRRLRQAWLVAELARLPAADRRVLGAALTIFERMLNPETPS